MAKISLQNPTSGYNLAAINDNFDKIEVEFQNKVLYRNNPSGEPNQMENNLDMNSKRILNLPSPSNLNEPARLRDVQNSILGISDANLISYTPPQSGATVTTVAAILNANFNPGNATAVTGGVAKIDAIMEPGSPNFPAQNVGGYWGGGPVYIHAAVSHEFKSSDPQGVGESPAIGLLVYANNNNSTRDVVGLMSLAVARTNDDIVFGANIIATNLPGNTNSKLVGLEIDVQPSLGSTVSTQSAGLYINAFSILGCGPAIQIDGVFGGSFSNGIQIGNMLSPNSSGLAPVTTATMDTLINTGAGTYITGAIKVSNTHKVLFAGTGATSAQIFNSASNFLNLVGGSAGTVIRDHANIKSLLAIADGGVVTLSATGTINWNGAQTGTSVGAAGAASAPPATPEKWISVQVDGVTGRIAWYN